MSEWRDKIIQRFQPAVARVTAVSDADGLLRDPGVFQAIQAKGFSIVQYEGPVSFRFDYESRFRAKWDAGEQPELVVVFKPGEHEFETLPADVLANAQRLSFTLKDIFPKLSYTVVSQLETVYFDQLYRAQQHSPSQFHDNAQTRGFILLHVFGIEPAIIKSIPDLLRMLCQRHYNKASIPPMLDDHLVACLRQNHNFDDWDLDTLVRNRAAFWEFLNERWSIFVRQSKGGTVKLHEDAPAFKYRGPALLPFGHDDVRIYIDNLFEDGLLNPVAWDWGQALEKTWIRVGLLGNKTDNTDLRFEELGKNLMKACPGAHATPQEWLAYAYRYAQANVLWSQISPASRATHKTEFPDLRAYINQQFYAWLVANYGGLFNYPASSPLMVHHIPGFIAHQLANKLCQRAAFILLDGMAVEHWLLLKDSLKAQGLNTPIQENALLAWIPTVTPISRQAAFSGAIPRYFPETFLRTDRDENGWRRFWGNRNLSPADIAFVSVTGDNCDLTVIEDAITIQTRALGVTLYKIDKIMHGMQLGTLGMAGQITTWAHEGFLFKLLKRLAQDDFDVFISADHGGVEAQGVGRPKEGVLSEKRGERCRIYTDPALQKTCISAFPDALPWNHPGLPENICCLLTPYGKAFTDVDKTLVCHGGASLEEVCVPFIHIPSHL